MAQKTERWFMNHLIETCKDGERGFRYAADHVGDGAMKALFLDIAAQREAFAAALLTHAHRMGGANESEGTVAGALHRGWMTLRDALGGAHHDAALLTEAERGEHAALAAYTEALTVVLTPGAREEIERQRGLVEQSYTRLRTATPV